MGRMNEKFFPVYVVGVYEESGAEFIDPQNPPNENLRKMLELINQGRRTTAAMMFEEAATHPAKSGNVRRRRRREHAPRVPGRIWSQVRKDLQ